MKIKITSDSTCDLSQELIEKYNVGIIPLNLVMGGKVLKDGVDVRPEDVFENVAATGVLPKTAALSAVEYAEYFTSFLKDCDAVIHFNISSKCSSSYNIAQAAAKTVKGKVYVIDSLALSTGQGLLVLKACDLAAEGKSPKEIVNTIELLRNRVNTSFVPDTLEYLHKGGRCSLAALMGAKVLKLHPLIDMKDGQLYAKKKYMGNLEACLRSYVKELSAMYPSYDNSRCFITHSSCEPQVVAKVKEQVSSLFKFEEVIETVAGSVVTGHCGKNTLGVLFIHN